MLGDRRLLYQKLAGQHDKTGGVKCGFISVDEFTFVRAAPGLCGVVG